MKHLTEAHYTNNENILFAIMQFCTLIFNVGKKKTHTWNFWWSTVLSSLISMARYSAKIFTFALFIN
jgi:hypothetical protein